MKRGAAVYPRVWGPVTRPADVHAWVTAEDVLRHALAAFYALVVDGRREFDAEEAAELDYRQGFADDLIEEFGLRLATQMHQVGLSDPGGHHREAARMLQRRQLDRASLHALPAEHVLQESSVTAVIDLRLTSRGALPD
ncbi:MAG: hypothetical protein KJ901_23275 [Gammaproteobacteria bacterium]|nr:hypothetical protein [Gammaproteobacteria bacterium]MBU1442155.1 hypothetical protein [Gammaproteobacteria bacterium]